MRRLFLLTYGDELGTREEVKNAIDANSLILNWRYDLPHSFYLVADISAKELAASIRESLPKGRFVVTVADHEYWGWNRDETWYLFKNKATKPASDA
jgi:hypothetical protein